MSAFEIICPECGAGPALLELLKLLNQPLAFRSFTGARQQQAQIVEGSFVVGFSLNSFAKSVDRFLIPFLLHKDLANVYVCTDIGSINLQHLSEFSDRSVKTVLRAGDQSENVVRLRGVPTLSQSFFSFSFRSIDL